MAGRKGAYSVYLPEDLEEDLRRLAAAAHRTLSQEITRILTEAVHGRRLPPGMVDRRAPESPQRRRAADPPERRRRGDLAVGTEPDARVEQPAPTAPGKARRHFGAWRSNDKRSADNERIDLDLAREYDSTS
jgi:hypothetical protein